MQANVSPLSCAIGDQQYVADFFEFQRGPGDACLVEKLAQIEQSGELESATRAEVAPNFLCQLLLTLNPLPISAWLKHSDLALAQWRNGICVKHLANGIEF